MGDEIRVIPGSLADQELGRLRKRVAELEAEKRDALDQFRPIISNLGRYDLDDGRLGNISRFIVTRIRGLQRTAGEYEKETTALKERLDGANRELSVAQGSLRLQKQNLQLAEQRARNAEDELKRLRDELSMAKRQLDAEQKLATELRREIRDRLSPPEGMAVAETDAEDGEGYGLPPEFVRLSTAALERFAEGYAEYGPGAADALGIAGQWGDLHRKVMKLKPSLWSGGTSRLTRESETDILNDIIGHSLLALEMIERGMDGGR